MAAFRTALVFLVLLLGGAPLTLAKEDASAADFLYRLSVE